LTNKVNIKLSESQAKSPAIW